MSVINRTNRERLRRCCRGDPIFARIVKCGLFQIIEFAESLEVLAEQLQDCGRISRAWRGNTPMTTLAKLLARKQKLLERLQENPGPNERDEIERLIAQIDTALDLLEAADDSSDGATNE